ncbi:MAG: hypothetical protein ACYC2O_09305 [Microthrixaceae bacterium]
MDQQLLAMLNDSEQQLLRAVEPKRLRKLDEDELIDLHTRVRRARTKYTKLYRRRAAAQVGAKGSRSGASTAGSKTRRKAEGFETALSTVSARLAEVAQRQSDQLRKDRLAAAKGTRSGAAKKAGTAAKKKGGSSSGTTARSGRRGDADLKSPARKRKVASQRATKARQQAKRSSKK